jgi:hypothetical protein
MSAHQDNCVVAGSANATPSTNTSPTAASDQREGGPDPLCSANIDAQIRWFFENAVQQENSNT